jgi:hypothetical protein
MSNKPIEYSTRITNIVNAKSKQLQETSGKNIVLVFQIGFLIGWLSRLAKDDIVIKQEIEALERELDIRIEKH